MNLEKTQELKTSSQVLDIAIIGGGITGLAAAYEIQPHPVSFQVFEASSSIGGKISTDMIETKDGAFLLEHGPDSFLVQKPWAHELAKKLGLKNEILETNSHQRHIFVLKKGHLRKMPEGMMLMIPTRFWPFVTTNLLSWLGKIRAAFEFFIPRKKDDSDESVADFVRRRMGNEILNYIADPLLAGIYNADSSQQSLRATFPQFAAMEEKNGSLIRGMLSAPKSKAKSPFISFQNGMQTLVSALEKKLQSQIKTNAKVQSCRRTQGGLYELVFSDQQTCLAKSVIITTPAKACSILIESVAPESAELLSKLRTIASGCIYLAYARSDIEHPLAGFGLVIPGSEKRAINAVTWVSSKMNYRAPKNTVLLRVFFGGHKNPEMMTKTDSQIEEIARQELRQIMKIQSVPLFSKIYRSNHENPQYDVGHLTLVEKIKNALPSDIHVAGSAYLGVGIPDCVLQGNLAGQKALQSVLRKQSSVL